MMSARKNCLYILYDHIAGAEGLRLTAGLGCIEHSQFMNRDKQYFISYLNPKTIPVDGAILPFSPDKQQKNRFLRVL